MAHTTAERAVMKFKVGQKYKVCGNVPETGNIIKITEVIGCRACYETIKGENNGCSVFETNSIFANELKPLNAHCIVIYENGAETVALDKTTGKKAVAKCSPQDTYDFYTGAKLAFERLTGAEEKPQKQYFNGKAVCVKGDNTLTMGKVYEFVDGVTRDNGGFIRPSGYRLENLKQYENRSGGTYKFIKLVE